MCGSVFLDCRFQKFIIDEIVGKTTYEKLKEKARQAILSCWQNDIKIRFEGPDTSDDYQEPGGFIPLPGCPNIPKHNVEDGMFYMERQVSDSLSNDCILSLTNGQSPDTENLRSEYLRNHGSDL